MERMLHNIKKNIYEIDSILSTDIILNILKEYNINTQSFHKSILNLQNNIHILEQYDDKMIIDMLNQKLQYFVNNTTDNTKISLYYTQISIAMTFIQNKINEIIKAEDNAILKEYQLNINYLNNIEIKNFYSIKNLKLENLKDKKEIYIVGENGDGKTLLLQSLVIGLKGINIGSVFDITQSQKELRTNIIFDEDINFDIKNGEYQNLFAYGSNRNNSCKMEIDKLGYLTLFDNAIDLYHPIEWLKELYNASKSGENFTINLDNIIDIIKNILQKDVKIEVSYKDVKFIEKGAIVDFDQLSAGYRSVIIIICDLLKRLTQNQVNIKNISDFKGIVLIDEVELHLHPKWKYEFISILRKILPNIQFIVTTHSPTVILGASKEAVFYKIFKEDGKINISDQIANKGYTNNTLIF